MLGAGTILGAVVRVGTAKERSEGCDGACEARSGCRAISDGIACAKVVMNSACWRLSEDEGVPGAG